MQRTTLLVLFVVVLVAFAGCNTFSGWWDTAPETPLVTPMDVPTDAPPPSDTRQLPAQCRAGLPDIGVPNASALVAAHNATLWNTSITVRIGSTRIAQNGSVLSRSHTTTYIAQNYSRLYFISEGVRRSPPDHYTRFERWTNGERVLTREISGHTTHYEARPLPQNEKGHFRSLARHSVALPRAVLDNATACVTDQFTHTGTALFVVAFTSARQPPWFGRPNATVLGNVTGRALVGSSASVYELRWHYRVRTADGAVVTVTKSKYYTDIGATTVDRPLWYEKALNQTQPTNRTTTAG
jgi:hypothetical protein